MRCPLLILNLRWTDNDVGPVEVEGSNEDVLQHLGIVSLLPIEREKVKISDYVDIPLHHHVEAKHSEQTFIESLKVKVVKKPRLTSGIRFVLFPC